jgi:hypothetical protein
MRSNIGEDSGARAALEGVVRWDCYVMLKRRIGGEPNATTRLTGNTIASSSERFDKISAGQVSRQFHAAMTSSRTK